MIIGWFLKAYKKGESDKHMCSGVVGAPVNPPFVGALMEPDGGQVSILNKWVPDGTTAPFSFLFIRGEEREKGGFRLESFVIYSIVRARRLLMGGIAGQLILREVPCVQCPYRCQSQMREGCSDVYGFAALYHLPGFGLV